MNPIEWLCARAPGFRQLTDSERSALTDFALLWSFFEARVLGSNASAASIVRVVRQWDVNGRARVESFDHSLQYFRKRYFRDGMYTEEFEGLRLRGNDFRPLVENVLSGENSDAADNVIALFVILYRLRNNLFHGNKWDYGIADQFDNFSSANAALMSALDMYGDI